MATLTTAAPHATAEHTSPTLTEPPVRWHGRTFAWGVAGAIATWTAFPPLEWWPAAWVAPILWLLLIRRRELGGRRPYLALWLAGFVYFGMLFYWIALPHWSAKFGWIVLSAYLACYLPAFIGLARVAVHRLGLSLIFAGPIVWTAMELVRAYLFTGFLMGALGHTQYAWLELIQISDLVGAYGVSFLVMFVAACLARLLPCEGRPVAWWPILPAAALVMAVVFYGRQKVAEDHARPEPKPKIALVQGTIDTQFGVDAVRIKDEAFRQYLDLSRSAAANHEGLDLVVWPESMYRWAWFELHEGGALPEQLPPESPQESLKALAGTAEFLESSLLLAIDRVVFTPAGREVYSSSVHVGYDAQTQTGKVRGRYDKMHPVMFGEYVPLGDIFPWLYNLTPLSGGLTRGTRAEAFEVGKGGTYRVSPTICFESVVPHLMRWQMLDLAARGEMPDVLITQTNDGWFWGSAALDMHVVCGVFRAIECRRPFLTAANTGISASIDAWGRIDARAGKRVPDVIIAEPKLVDWDSPYVRHGDWFAWTCLAATALFGAVGLICGRGGK
jgi:apolipoprotein N-acyltransferase